MKTSLKESKSRSWDDITLDTLITQIAGEHDLEPIVGSDLKAVHYDHIDQTEESDLHLLTRLASDLDAVSKPTHQKLVFVTRGDEKSATGQELPTVELKPADVTNWSANLSDRWKYKSVIARYHSLDEAVEKEVKVGTGSPTQTIRRTYATEEEAKRAAQGRYNRYKRGKGKLMITMPGNATVYAETPLSLSGFGEGVDTKWVVTTVKHRLNKQGGFFTQLEAELKD